MDVIAAAVVENGRLLVVSKQAAPDVFYLPGGKPDPDEPEHRTLERELVEEIQARPLAATPYLVVEAAAALEGVPMRLSVYRCALDGKPQRSGEIADLGWTSGRDRYAALLAPAIRDVVVPSLMSDGIL
jgi:8-oxo-dGTP pyrophosphatase MutT (NUDIX family)